MYARVFIMAQYCMYCTRTHIRTVLLHVPVLTLGQSYIYPFSYIHILVHMVMTASVNIKQRVSHVGTGDWGVLVHLLCSRLLRLFSSNLPTRQPSSPHTICTHVLLSLANVNNTSSKLARPWICGLQYLARRLPHSHTPRLVGLGIQWHKRYQIMLAVICPACLIHKCLRLLHITPANLPGSSCTARTSLLAAALTLYLRARFATTRGRSPSSRSLVADLCFHRQPIHRLHLASDWPMPVLLTLR